MAIIRNKQLKGGKIKMGKKDNIEKIVRDVESSVPFPVPGVPDIYTTTIVRKDGEKYTGTGSSRAEADKDAGQKYSKGDSD